MQEVFFNKVMLQELSDESLHKVFNDYCTRFEEHNYSSRLFDLKSSLTFDKTVVINQNFFNNDLKRT